MSNKKCCNCGCDEFIRRTYDVVKVNSEVTDFISISHHIVEEDFGMVNCRDCGCEVSIEDGEFVSYCECNNIKSNNQP